MPSGQCQTSREAHVAGGSSSAAALGEGWVERKGPCPSFSNRERKSRRLTITAQSSANAFGLESSAPAGDRRDASAAPSGLFAGDAASFSPRAVISMTVQGTAAGNAVGRPLGLRTKPLPEATKPISAGIFAKRVSQRPCRSWTGVRCQIASVPHCGSHERRTGRSPQARKSATYCVGPRWTSATPTPRLEMLIFRLSTPRYLQPSS